MIGSGGVVSANGDSDRTLGPEAMSNTQKKLGCNLLLTFTTTEPAEYIVVPPVIRVVLGELKRG